MAAHAFDRGGAPDGTLGIALDRFYGEDYVCIELADGSTEAHLTAGQARAVAADLIAHAAALEEHRKPRDWHCHYCLHEPDDPRYDDPSIPVNCQCSCHTSTAAE